MISTIKHTIPANKKAYTMNIPFSILAHNRTLPDKISFLNLRNTRFSTFLHWWPSNVPIIDPSPKLSNIKKNMTAQNGAPGNLSIASVNDRFQKNQPIQLLNVAMQNLIYCVQKVTRNSDHVFKTIPTFPEDLMPFIRDKNTTAQATIRQNAIAQLKLAEFSLPKSVKSDETLMASWYQK
uniref:Uncharacterized protein n=1 Tax=Romanomermis culicivorax TaxID=13658 RepID=A0A915KQI8_ROMCU